MNSDTPSAYIERGIAPAAADDDGDQFTVDLVAVRLDEVPPVHHGQHQIQHDGVLRATVANRHDRTGTIVNDINLMALVGQNVRKHGRDHLIVLDNEDD